MDKISIQDTFYQTTNFEELRNIINKSKIHLSFFGCYYYTVQNHHGYLTGIDAFTVHLMKLIKQMNYEFNEQQREIGKEIKNKIDSFYQQADKLHAKSCLFTRTLSKIRDFWDDFSNNINIDISLRYDWREDRANELFSLYTLKQYQKCFHANPGKHNYNATMGAPHRWHAPPR